MTHDEILAQYGPREAMEYDVVVVGGETNGYWSMMGATYRKSVSVDEWR